MNEASTETVSPIRITPVATPQGNLLRIEILALPGLQLHITEAAAETVIVDLAAALAVFPDKDIAAPSSVANEARVRTAKRLAFESCVAHGSTVVQFDATHPICQVPAHVRQDFQVLRFGLELNPPITDMVCNNVGIQATLTFNGKPSLVMVPWDAVFGVALESTKQGLAWPESAPQRLRAMMIERAVQPDQVAKGNGDTLTDAQRAAVQAAVIQDGQKPSTPTPTPTPTPKKKHAFSLVPMPADVGAPDVAPADNQPK